MLFDDHRCRSKLNTDQSIEDMKSKFPSGTISLLQNEICLHPQLKLENDRWYILNKRSSLRWFHSLMSRNFHSRCIWMRVVLLIDGIISRSMNCSALPLIDDRYKIWLELLMVVDRERHCEERIDRSEQLSEWEYLRNRYLNRSRDEKNRVRSAKIVFI